MVVKTKPITVNRRYPSAPLVGVGVVVFNQQGEVLLAKRGKPPRAGEWSLPGGLIDLGDSESLMNALEGLHGHDPRGAEVVTLHMLCGHPLPKVAEMLAVSVPTIERDWKNAKAQFNFCAFAIVSYGSAPVPVGDNVNAAFIAAKCAETVALSMSCGSLTFVLLRLMPVKAPAMPLTTANVPAAVRAAAVGLVTPALAKPQPAGSS